MKCLDAASAAGVSHLPAEPSYTLLQCKEQLLSKSAAKRKACLQGPQLQAAWPCLPRARIQKKVASQPSWSHLSAVRIVWKTMVIETGATSMCRSDFSLSCNIADSLLFSSLSTFGRPNRPFSWQLATKCACAGQGRLRGGGKSSESNHAVGIK